MRKSFSVGTRQVHLDFHTSEKLPEIGKHFSKKQFQAALIAGNVNAINIFAKGTIAGAIIPPRSERCIRILISIFSEHR